MTTHEPTGFERRVSVALAWWMNGARQHAGKVLIAALVLTCGAAWLTATQLGINSNVRGLIGDDVPHRRAEIAFEKVFPARFYDLAIVLRGPTAEDTESYAEDLKRLLSSREDVVAAVTAPFLETYFRRNALMFLDQPELAAMLERITLAAPVLGDLNRDLRLETLFSSLAKGDRLDRLEIDASSLNQVYDELAGVIDSWVAGSPRRLSWQKVLSDSDNESDGVQRTLIVRPIQDFTALQPASATLSAIEHAIAETGRDYGPGIRAGVTGDPALRREELGSVLDGIGVSLALSGIAVLVLLFVAFRSSALVVAALLVLAVNLVLTAGFAALTVGHLNMISVAFAVLMIGLGADFVIHVTLHIQRERRHGSDLRAAIRHTADEIGPALLLAALTTSAAFLSFVPTDFIGIAQLGLIAGGGVMLAMLGAVTLLPATFGLLGNRIAGAGTDLPPGAEHIRKPALIRPLALLTILAAVISLPLLGAVRFDADPMNLRDPASESVRTFQQLFEDPDAAPYGLDLLTDSLEQADDIAERLAALPEVRQAVTLSSFVPTEQTSKLDLIEFAADTLYYPLNSGPSARDRSAVVQDSASIVAASSALRAALTDSETGQHKALATSLARLEKRLIVSGADVAALHDAVFGHFDTQLERLRQMLSPAFVTAKDVPQYYRDSFVAPDGHARIDIAPQADTRDSLARKEFVEAVQAVAPDVTGAAVGFIATGKVVARSILEATLLAAAGGALLLWLFARSVPLVLLILLPLGLAGILTSASGVLLDIPYNFANVIVIPLLIGLGVDSGIHLALRARHAPGEFTVYRTTTPRAVLFSALTTIVSFGTLALSAHRGTASMGALLTLGVGFTLLCTLVVLPVLLHAAWTDRVEASY